MNKLRSFLFIFSLLAFFNVDAQLIYSNNYTSGSFPGTASGVGTLTHTFNTLFWSGFQGGQSYRYQDPLNLITGQFGLGQHETWRAEFDFEFDENSGSQTDYGAILFALSSDVSHFQNTGGTSVSVWFGDVLGANDNKTYLFFRAETPGGFQTPSAKIYIGVSNSSVSNRYFARIERKSEREFVMAIYDDPSRESTSLVGQVCYETEENQLVGDLLYLQHGASTTASATRYASGNLQNMKIYDDVLECCDCDLTADFSMTDPYACPIEFMDQSTSCSNTIHMGSIFNFGDNNFGKVFPGGSIFHGYNSPYIGTQVNLSMTAMAYYYDHNTNSYECCTNTKTMMLEPNDECPAEPNPTFARGDCPDAALINQTVSNRTLSITTPNWLANRAFMGAVIEWGDGNVSHLVNSNQQYNHTYGTPGIYNVCVTTFGFYFGPDGEVFCCKERECYSISISGGSGGGLPIDPLEQGNNTGDGGTGTNRIGISPDHKLEVPFQAYPNPFKDELIITHNAATDRIVVMNAVGKLVSEVELTHGTQTILDLSKLEDGIYFVRKFSGSQIEILKIIKQ